MLTKENRAVIAERLNNYDYESLWGLYRELIGVEEPEDTTYKEDVEAFCKSLIDLCDTSNMIELPLDKNGEVIRIGDTVYDSVGDEYKVTGYKTLFEDTNITLSNGSEVAYTEMYPHKLTHKQPVTIKSLAQRIRDVLRNDHSEMSPYTSRELVHIANDLERLGDNNE